MINRAIIYFYLKIKTQANNPVGIDATNTDIANTGRFTLPKSAFPRLSVANNMNKNREIKKILKKNLLKAILFFINICYELFC